MTAAGASARPGAELFEQLRERLSFDVPAGLSNSTAAIARGDHDIDSQIRALAESVPSRKAAVLIPIVAHESPTVLLTLRSTRLPDHAGQVAFPGGKIDPEDRSPVETALREAEEEIGLDRAHVEPLGYLDLYLSGTGFRILPVVARVRPGFALSLNPDEVDDAFEVPFTFLMTPANHQRHSREWKGVLRSYYAMPFGERYIWGVTAGIIMNLYQRVYEQQAAARTAV